MIVFLKTSEEAFCETCDYLFTSVIPNITETALAYDEATHAWQLTVTGTDISSGPELYVEGKLQTTVSSSTTDAVFSIVDVSSSVMTTQKLYFDVGIPESHSVVQTE